MRGIRGPTRQGEHQSPSQVWGGSEQLSTSLSKVVESNRISFYLNEAKTNLLRIQMPPKSMENLNIQPSEGTGTRMILRIQVARTRGKSLPSVNIHIFYLFSFSTKIQFPRGGERAWVAHLRPLAFSLAGDGENILNNSLQKSAYPEWRLDTSNEKSEHCFQRKQHDAEQAQN